MFLPKPKLLLVFVMTLVPMMVCAVGYGADRPVVMPLADQPSASPYVNSTSLPLFGQRRSVAPLAAASSFDLSQRSSSGSFSVFTFTTSGFSKNGKNRRSWTRDNLLQTDGLMSSGSRYASSGSTAQELNGSAGSSGPRRVGGDDHDPDPFMGEPVPVGSTPYILLAMMAAVYVVIRKRKMC